MSGMIKYHGLLINLGNSDILITLVNLYVSKTDLVNGQVVTGKTTEPVMEEA